jgi:hypothetical protein
MKIRNTHSRITSLALAVALALGGTVAGPLAGVAQAAESKPPAKPAVSRKLVKPLQAAQEAIGAKKFDEAIAALKTVEASPERTPYDTFVMSQLYGFALVQMKQNAEAIPYFEAQAASGFLEPAEADRIAKGVASLYYQQENYPKAAETGRKLIDAGRADDETYTLVAQAEFLQKNFPAVASLLGPYVRKLDEAGEVPKEPTLQLLSESYLRTNDAKNATQALTMLVKHHPKPQYWSNLLNVKRTEAGGDLGTFHVYWLMNEVGVLTEANDVNELVDLSVKLGAPGEGLSVLQKAIAAGVYKTDQSKASADSRLKQITALANTDKAGLPAFEKEAAAAKGGEGEVRLGQALLSYGQADKAAAAIQRGIAKGSLRNADEAQLLLGIALLGAGRKDEAIAAFSSPKGGDAKLADLASLWALHARR